MTIPMIACNTGNYSKGRSGTIQYLVLHYTANNGDTAQNNGNYFANNSVGASAHYFVDETECIQSVADENTAWHCGSSSGIYTHMTCRNSIAIGIEMCSRKDSNENYYIMDETVANAVTLTKYLMALYGIPITNALRHYDVTGKSCPAPWVTDESQWTSFLQKLTEEENDMADVSQERFQELFLEMRTTLQDNDASNWSQEARDWAVNNGLIQGSDTGAYMWEDFLTREQMAMLLFRFAQMMGNA